MDRSYVTATITEIYCKSILTVKIHSAHNKMIQIVNKSVVEVLEEYADKTSFQTFSQHVTTSLWAAFLLKNSRRCTA